MSDVSCLFCKIVAGEIPSNKIMETDEVLVIKDINPRAPIHYLILPKAHLVNLTEMTQADAQHVYPTLDVAHKLAQELDEPKGFNLIANNGENVGQSVPHFHWHFLSGCDIYSTEFSL